MRMRGNKSIFVFPLNLLLGKHDGQYKHQKHLKFIDQLVKSKSYYANLVAYCGDLGFGKL